ncbi:MAG TPA: ribulose-phosphate 3-epimerase [Dehalococcoidia bacterium]|nr:ribulose-phosphate 3-epimerase [Dehalococcoidia bacterium]
MAVPVKLAPSILTADFGRIAEQVQEAVAAGADYVHLDVMDGHVVPVITFGPALVAAVRKAVDVPLDIHLMIDRPDDHLAAFRDAGGDILNVHAEASRHLHRTLGEVRRLGARAGVCLNPATPLDAIAEVLGEVDQVMIMAVNPGWGGQKFIESSLEKVRRLRQALDGRGLTVDIEVDGGVNLTTGPRCVAAGANVLVAGSFVYNDRASVAENLRALREAVGGS